MKTLLFDLDGTISDPKVGITKSVAYALQRFHITVEDLDSLTPFIGPPLQESFMHDYGFDEEKAQQAIEYYRIYFNDRGMYENTLYDTMEEILAKLCARGYTCIIATSKPEVFAKQIVDYFHIQSYFKDVCGATMDSQRTRKEDVIAYAMKKHSLSTQQTMMIGDRKHDVIGAKINQLPSIGVRYGYGGYQELSVAGADHIVDTPQELYTYLVSLEQETRGR